MEKLYDIILDSNKKDINTQDMYIRKNFLVKKEGGGYILEKNEEYDFLTYFNALSIKKWKEYTHIKRFYLVLEICGDFDLLIEDAYANTNNVHKRYIFAKRFSCTEKKEMVVPIEEDDNSTVVGFCIRVKEDSTLFSAHYAVDIDEDIRYIPEIALVTTTFKKEEYVKRNINILTEELFKDDFYGNHFFWNIIDNGQSLDLDNLPEQISIIKNPNLGGAGGFARGMLESLNQKREYTHILLMDDDVMFMAESFKRLYMLLSLLKEEYRKYFVSGAMLKMDEPNIQHEDVGVLVSRGYHMAVKPNLDMNFVDSFVKNEEYSYSDGNHYYAAWWFCCMPVGTVRYDNLPLPIFVRGDDVEYSLRNDAKFITMNGLCIWHEGFEGKFSGAMEFYQVMRNELILSTVHDSLSDVDVFNRIIEIFWQQVYKFDYKGANLLLDAIEDYLKGPEYIFSLDGGNMMKEKKKADNKPVPITDEVRGIIGNSFDLYEYSPLSKFKKFVYDYSYNGQARLPEIFTSGKGCIPYGFGYFQKKMFLNKEIYAADLNGDNYVLFKKDRREFRKTKKRYNEIMKEYNEKYNRVQKDYKNAFNEVRKADSWEQRFKR